MAVDTESQLITTVTVLPGNAADSDHALELVCQSEKNAQVKVEESVAHCAYGDGATRDGYETVWSALLTILLKWPSTTRSSQPGKICREWRCVA